MSVADLVAAGAFVLALGWLAWRFRRKSRRGCAGCPFGGAGRECGGCTRRDGGA